MKIRTLNRNNYPIKPCAKLFRGDTLKIEVKEDGNRIYLEDKARGKTKIDMLSVMDLINVPGFKGQCRAIILGEVE